MGRPGGLHAPDAKVGLVLVGDGAAAQALEELVEDVGDFGWRLGEPAADGVLDVVGVAGNGLVGGVVGDGPGRGVHGRFLPVGPWGCSPGR